MHSFITHPTTNRRRGSSAVVVLATILVIAGLLAAHLQSVIRYRRSLADRHAHIQRAQIIGDLTILDSRSVLPAPMSADGQTAEARWTVTSNAWRSSETLTISTGNRGPGKSRFHVSFDDTERDLNETRSPGGTAESASDEDESGSATSNQRSTLNRSEM